MPGPGQFGFCSPSASELTRVTIQTSDATCEQGGTCTVGNIGPGGGIVFYYNPSGFNEVGAPCSPVCHYLEAAPTSGDSRWTDITAPWSGNTSSALVTGIGSEIGAGFANSNAIVSQENAGSENAAALARNYSGPNSKHDWFLSSSDELGILLSKENIVDIAHTFVEYWTSTQWARSPELYAMAQNALSGVYYGDYKDSVRYVRPICAF